MCAPCRAQIDRNQIIRIKFGEGIAGLVAQTGEFWAWVYGCVLRTGDTLRVLGSCPALEEVPAVRIVACTAYQDCNPAALHTHTSQCTTARNTRVLPRPVLVVGCW